MRQAIASPRSCATLLTRSVPCTQTTTYDVLAPVHAKESIKAARCSVGLGILSSPTHSHSQSSPILRVDLRRRLLIPIFLAFRPTHFIYNQSCPELVVKISPTRLVLLSRLACPRIVSAPRCRRPSFVSLARLPEVYHRTRR